MSVRQALLGLLSEGPKYGMQLRNEYEETTGDVWPLNVGQVYTTLQRLERDGLVVSEDAGADDRQRTYRITAEGESGLRDWLRGLEPAAPPRDELVTKVLVALKVPGVDVHEIIQAHRRQALELMQQWTRFRADESQSDLAFALVADAEVTRLAGVVKWLDLADKHVKNAAKSSAKAPAPKLRRRVVVRQ